jgi:TrkA domain protein
VFFSCLPDKRKIIDDYPDPGRSGRAPLEQIFQTVLQFPEHLSPVCSFRGIFDLPLLSHRPVRDLSSGCFNNVSREEALPSKEASDAGSVRTSLLPTSQNPRMQTISLFVFCLEYFCGGYHHTIIIYLGIIFLMSAMALRSLNLPGLGTKYEFETEKGDTVAIFFTKSGLIQMYTLQKGCIIEADQESVEIAFSALADLRITIHTFYVPKSVTGKTIEELQIRAKTGATIIAVCRNDKNIINPAPTFAFEAGDAALVIGESDQIKRFEREIMVD